MLCFPALFIDFYELAMAQAYLEEGMAGNAVFSLFVRRLPKGRNFLVFCGLETVLQYIENLRFSEDDITYLKSTGRFSDYFLSWLKNFRFTGSIYAMAEGTPFFANEPIIEVSAPIIEAQLIETFIINQIQLQTMLCTKAVRIVNAAKGRNVIDFSARRTHGIDAAVNAARAFYIGGVSATSNVLAGKIYGIPVTGTMAHSYIQAHKSEIDAFRSFARIYPKTVLLVDTYDSIEGVKKVISLSKELGPDFKISGVRFDSGDILALTRRARKLLDEAGLKNVKIIASSSLDEYKIQELIDSGAPIDAFGVGANMGVSIDSPVLDIVYKLCEYEGKGRMKLSPDKMVLPGQKQVFRIEKEGVIVNDTIARFGEKANGRPLLEEVMRNGRRIKNPMDLDAIRENCQIQLSKLPQELLKAEQQAKCYEVKLSPKLTDYLEDIKNQIE